MESKIKEVLKNGPLSNSKLRTSLGLKPKTKRSGDTKLDKTLQKMKRAGKIVVKGGRWVDSSVKICPGCDGKGWVNG
jgi:hypothetical protein